MSVLAVARSLPTNHHEDGGTTLVTHPFAINLYSFKYKQDAFDVLP
jgi:hypothetical protein